MEAVDRRLAIASRTLDPDERVRLRVLVDALPARFAAVAGCGIPDSVVHGDFHPGNTHGSTEADGRIVLLDWGDCGIGNPLLDQAAALASIRPEQRGPLRAHWARLWRTAVPGCDPDRAAELLAPIRALRQALVYQAVLDGIEPDERVYHSGDPAHWLRQASTST
jgi:aminoglycoside phosphotransferase (APT) family kinase protein